MDIIYRLFRRFEWMRVYFSPFKLPVPKFYIGKISLGTPYFFPRKWVKLSEEHVEHKVQKANENLPDDLPDTERETILNKIRESSRNSERPIPKKVGFDFVGLGWKTKFSDTHYRFEHGPVWSFVFFGIQFAITFSVPKMDRYWECWLFYNYSTDKTKSRKERIRESRKDFPCIWSTTRGGPDGILSKTETCYWDHILKNKYLNE